MDLNTGRVSYSRNLYKIQINGYYMKVVLRKTREKDKEKFNGQMAVTIKGNLTKMREVVKVK